MARRAQRIVVDTHVFLQALTEAPSDETDAYRRLIAVCHRLVVNRSILEEYRSIANRHGFSAQQIDTEMARLRGRGKVEQCASRKRRRVEVGASQDRCFLECASAARAVYILTNDERLIDATRSLQRRGSAFRTQGITPGDFLRLDDGR